MNFEFYNMSLDTILIIGILCWMVISIFMFTPLSVFISRKFYKQSHNQYFHARRPRFVNFLDNISIYYQIIHIPIFLFFALYLYPNKNDIHHCTVTMTWFTTGFHCVILSFHIRYWLICYDLLYNSAIADMKWIKPLLTNTLHKNRLPFTMKYRTIIGKPKFFLILLIILTLLTAFLSFGSCFIDYDSIFKSVSPVHLQYQHYSGILILMIIFQLLCFKSSIIITFVLHKLGEDNIDFRKCISKELYIQIFGIIGTIYGAVMTIIGRDFGTPYVAIIQWTILPSLSFYCVSIMFPFLSLHYYKQREKKRVAYDNNRTTNDVTLDHILSDKYGLKLFARHLVKEYCVENLLCLIEINYWKQICLNDSKCDVNNLKNEIIDFKFNQNVSLNEINTDTMQHWCNIYVKYINTTTASLEINISSRSRRKIQNIYKRLQIYSEDKCIIDCNELNNSFNGAIKEIKQNLEDSLSRLRNTNDYKQWEAEFELA
eukprot:295580_1